jgi:2-dehydropantoate 2-reductase
VTRIAVVGAGAIGGFLAAALANAGLPVSVLARGAHLDAIQREGLRVRSDLGDFAARVEASDDLRRLGAFDVLLLTFKAHQWPSLLTQLENMPGSPTVVTLQNGVPFWYVREPPLSSVDPGGRIGRIFGDERVIGGVVHVSGHIAEPGVIVQSGGLRYVLGAPGGGTNSKVDELAALFARARLAVEIDDNVRATIWLKLVNNSGLNPVSVIRRTSIQPLLADPKARAHVRALMSETLSVGQAMGAVADVDVDARIAYAARLADVKTSMLQDYEQGRPIELDPIVGAAIELADRHRIAVPYLRAAYAQLTHAAEGARK